MYNSIIIDELHMKLYKIFGFYINFMYDIFIYQF